jgi:hypothetical protein
MNPYTIRETCQDCPTGGWVIYNTRYPPEHERHEIMLCEPHYRLAEDAARHGELIFRDDFDLLCRAVAEAKEFTPLTNIA